MAITAEQMNNASERAIKAIITDNDAELIKSVTGIEDLNNNNIHSALDSIYINGKNLTDMLGEEKENSLAEYAKAVREALTSDDNSFVTIMNRNSIMAEPRAVILADAADSQKTQASLNFAAGYKEDVNNIVKTAKQAVAAGRSADLRLFFESLFDKNDNAESLSNMEYRNSVAQRFDHILPQFVNGRYTEDYVYAYMLTKDYPEGSGKKLTWEQIKEDDSPEMQEFKRKSGREFCRIFQRTDPDDVKQFNEVTYPTLIKMSEALLHLKGSYHDLSEKDDLKNAVLDSDKMCMVFNLLQQIQCTDLGMICRCQAFCNFNDQLMQSRLNYLGSDSFITGDILAPSKRYIKPECAGAVNFQSLLDNVDTHDIKKISNAVIGTMDLGQGTEFTLFLSGAAATAVEISDAQKYLNRQENALSARWKDGSPKKIFRETAAAAERGAEKENDNLVIDSISQSLGRDPVSHTIGLNALRDYYMGKDMYINDMSVPEAPYDGIRRSLLNELTGCPTILSRSPEQATADDKAMLMAAANAIYINNRTMAEYFHLDENNIAANIKEAEKKLAGIIITSMENNGPEFVFLKNGKDSFHEVNISAEASELPEPVRGEYGSDGEYDKAVERYKADTKYLNEINKVRNNIMKKSAETAKAYADVLNCKADKETIEKYDSVLKERKLIPPTLNMSLDKAKELFSDKGTGNILSALSGKELRTPSDFENAAKNIYIGDKTLSELCPQKEGMAWEECTKKREELLKKTFDKNLFVDDGKEPKAISVRDKNGNLKPLSIDPGKQPIRPKPVKPYSKFVAFFHSARSVEENTRAYDAYISAETKYVNEKTLYDRCLKYNNVLNDTRTRIITEERSGNPRKTITIDQAQIMHSNNRISAGRTRALSSPTVRHELENGGHERK